MRTLYASSQTLSIKVCLFSVPGLSGLHGFEGPCLTAGFGSGADPRRIREASLKSNRGSFAIFSAIVWLGVKQSVPEKGFTQDSKSNASS